MGSDSGTKNLSQERTKQFVIQNKTVYQAAVRLIKKGTPPKVRDLRLALSLKKKVVGKDKAGVLLHAIAVTEKPAIIAKNGKSYELLQ